MSIKIKNTKFKNKLTTQLNNVDFIYVKVIVWRNDYIYQIPL